MKIEAREPTDDEFQPAFETLGDTPSAAVFANGRLVAICPGDMDGHDAREIMAALIVRDDTVGLKLRPEPEED